MPTTRAAMTEAARLETAAAGRLAAVGVASLEVDAESIANTIAAAQVEATLAVAARLAVLTNEMMRQP